MNTTRLASIVLVVLASAANAQPGPSGPPPPPAPPPTVPAPYAYQPQVTVMLTEEDRELLERGEMPLVEHAGGGALAFAIGFGTGHMLQGRWTEIGWVFTLGEAASVGAVVYGLSKFQVDCNPNCNNTGPGTLIVTGLIGMAGLHVWEVLDAFIVPANQNRRIRELRMRLGYPPPQPQYGLYVAPAAGTNVAGLTLRF